MTHLLFCSNRGVVIHCLCYCIKKFIPIDASHVHNRRWIFGVVVGGGR